MDRTPRRMAVRYLLSAAGLLALADQGFAQAKEFEKDLLLRNQEMIRKYEPILPQIKAALKSDNPETKRAALSIITDIPEFIAAEAKLAPALLEFLKTPGHTAELQALALKSFGKTSPDPADARSVLQAASQSPDIRVQRAGVTTAAALVASAAPERKAIANAAYFMKIADAALPSLGPALEDDHVPTQLAAQAGMQTIAKVLNDVYDFEASSFRDDFKADPEKWTSIVPVLKAIDSQLPRFKKGFAASDPVARRTHAQIIEKFTTVRRMSLQSQGRIKADPFPTGIPAILPILSAHADDTDANVRLSILEAVEPLGDLEAARAIMLRKANDASLFVRWTAARGLGGAAPKELVDGHVQEVATLTTLAGDKDFDVRTAALTSLQRYKGAASSATPAVLAAAKQGDAEHRVVALNTLGEIKSPAEATIPALIDALQDADVRVQRAAALALVRFGGKAKSALPLLRKVVIGDDAELRFAAAQAILAIEKAPKDD